MLVVAVVMALVAMVMLVVVVSESEWAEPKVSGRSELPFVMW